MKQEIYNQLSAKIIECAISVHKHLGPGLLENVYETCLAKEFELNKIEYKRQFQLPLIYKGERLNCNYRIDFLIEGKIIVELKAVEYIMDVHEVQLVTYLKLSQMKLGLLINFNETHLIKGVRRKVNNF